MLINSKYTSSNFTYCIKSTNLHGILRKYDPARQMYNFSPLTNTFPIYDARPIIIPDKYEQPIEKILLNHIQNTKFNRKLYNLPKK